MQTLRNNKVLIFGGGSGLGKAIAKRMLQEKAWVTIAGRTESKLLAAKEELLQEFPDGKLQHIVCDIAQVDTHRSVLEQAEKMMDGVTAVVNAAALGGNATFGRGYEPWDITSEEWDLFNNTNYKGAFFLMRNEINYFLEKNIRGNILNFASNAAYTGIVGSYGAAKLDIIHWTRMFGNRYGHNGIIINGIAPGATFTPMISAYAKTIDQPYPRHAIERFIRPDEIAEIAFFLMSNFGEAICGHTVVADGGDNEARL